MSFNQTLTRISEIIGNALASMVIGLFGVFIAIMVDAITFFLSALILMTLKVKEQNVQNNNHYLENLKEGFDYLKTSKLFQLISIMSCIICFRSDDDYWYVVRFVYLSFD